MFLAKLHIFCLVSRPTGVLRNSVEKRSLESTSMSMSTTDATLNVVEHLFKLCHQTLKDFFKWDHRICFFSISICSCLGKLGSRFGSDIFVISSGMAWVQ